MKNYVIANGTVYEYEIPLGSFSCISASAKYGENLPEDVLSKIWGSLSLGASIHEAFAKVGPPNTAFTPTLLKCAPLQALSTPEHSATSQTDQTPPQRG